MEKADIEFVGEINDSAKQNFSASGRIAFPERRSSNAMDDLHDVVLAMYGKAMAIAGALLLATRPHPPEINAISPAVVTSAVDQRDR